MAHTKKDEVPLQALLIPKTILNIGKLLNWFSPFLASRFAARLFITPFRYPLPHREKKMYNESIKESLYIKKIRKEVMVYSYGNSDKKILLAHGWSGTGTQLSRIAETLLQNGYKTVSFDAPAHGKSPGKTSMMPYFIEIIHELEKTHGPFEAAIGHSLGGMSLLRAVKNGMSLQKLIIIGTANSLTAITDNFAKNMQLSTKTGRLMKSYFDKKFGEDLDRYSGSVSAKDVKIPTLVIHDKNDVDVHYSCAKEISQALENGQILLTEKLGHRKILGNKDVVKKIIQYIQH